ncbi:MAG: hypothetical protein JOZ19_01515 [Rubrobacter sp.]|nr:hypothetical protein [Rubrobacter sp.]
MSVCDRGKRDLNPSAGITGSQYAKTTSVGGEHTTLRRSVAARSTCWWTSKACLLGAPAYTAQRYKGIQRGWHQAAGVGAYWALVPEAPVCGHAGYRGRGKSWAEEALDLSVAVVRKPRGWYPRKWLAPGEGGQGSGLAEVDAA